MLKSDLNDRFQEWRTAGIIKHMRIDSLSIYDKRTGIDWKWQAMDGWNYYKGTSWEKNVQERILQTELNLY